MSVFIDGATISSLFYSHSGSTGNQEGFLFGRIINHVKDHISDSQINNSEVQTYVYVSSHLPWPSEDRVYSRGGVPIMEKLGSVVGEQKGEVIGWYSFRRGSTLRMSMKEKTLHRHLADRFYPQCPDDFLFCLCVSSATTDQSTHSMDHCFAAVKQSSGQMKKLPVLVTNLGDTSHTEYKTHASMGGMQMGSVRAVLNEFKPQFVSQSSEDMQEVKRIDCMSGVLNKGLVKLCQEVVESEKKTGDLEQEVAVLKEKLRQRDLERERQKQILLNPAEPKADVSAAGGKAKEVASLYPTLPAKVDMPSLGKGEACSVGQGSGTSQGQHVTHTGSKNCATAASLSQGPSVDELLCVSEVIPPVGEGRCESERLVSQPDELIDLEPSTTEEHSSESSLEEHKHAAKVDCAGSKDKVQESVEKLGKAPASKGSVGPQTMNTKANSKGSVPTKPSDHFSFVENMVKSASESTSTRKMATVPTGETLTYSPRTTRSQAKSETVASRQSSGSRDRSKLPVTGHHTDGASNMAAASPGTGKSASDGASSASRGQGGSSHRSGTKNSDGSGAGNHSAGGEPTSAQQLGHNLGSSHSGQKGSTTAAAAAASAKDSKVRKRLDPGTFNLEQQQNKTQVTTRSGRAAGGKDTDMHENGTNNKEDVEILPSSSPVF